MLTRSEYKSMAHQDLKGNWTQPVLTTLVFVLVSATTNIPMVGFLILLLIVLPMQYSYMQLFLEYKRGERENMFGRLFAFFQDYTRAFGTAFMVSLYTLLWSLLLIVPGIIKAIAYSQTYYIAKDHPEYSIDQCIEASMAMMRGHKGEYFMLYLSFIGWFLLGILTCGIGLLWIDPYMQTTFAHYYEDLKAENPVEMKPEFA